MNTQSYWLEESQFHSQPPGNDLQVDILIIGGGVTGVTAAYLLSKHGLSVALVERDQLFHGDSGHTTAHLTYMTDTPFGQLTSYLGEEAAAEAWRAGAFSMELIERWVKEENIDCGWLNCAGYLVLDDTASAKEAEKLRQEMDCISRHGFDVRWQDSIPPTSNPGIRFENQMKFHPVKYLTGLVKRAREMGATFFERTNIESFESQGRQVVSGQTKITYEHVLVATHMPLQGNWGTLPALMFQTKLFAYSTYVLQAVVPAGNLPEMIWSDTASPFHYLRIDRSNSGELVAVLGGEDHKTGTVSDTEKCFERLRRFLLRWMPSAKVEKQWSGQVIETADGLPFIGEVDSGQFIATGYSGNGYTFGTLAAWMFCDHVMGRTNPWKELFSPSRKKLSSALNYASENIDFPRYLIKDRMTARGADAAVIDDLHEGEGRVVKIDGQQVAVCKTKKGDVHALNAVCPHLGCIVHWNHAECTWDCPCHGSRFECDGKLLAGPAEKDLDATEIG